MIFLSHIAVRGLTFKYEGNPENIFENVNLNLSTDWKLGFIGRNGRGKTTFLQLLLDKYPYSGSINAAVNFDYFPFPVTGQERLTGQIIETIAPQAQEWEISRELNLLATDTAILDRSFAALSYGEQTKVLLAALFLRSNNFLLIDEPTNHLDTLGRQAVAHYLKNKQGFILVSHDRDFLDQTVDHILSLNKKNIEIQQGNFTSWYTNKQLQDKFELAQNNKLKGDIKRLQVSAKEKKGWSDKTEQSKIGSHAGDRGYIGHKAAKMMKRSKNIEQRQDKALAEKEKLLQNIEYQADIALFPLPYIKNRLLAVDNLSICFDNQDVFAQLSFELLRGDRIAVTGKNGCGKSSLLKLICGDNIQHRGLLEIGSNLIISYLPQEASHLKGNLSSFVKEQDIDLTLFLSLLRQLDFSREMFERDMSDFSGGQKKKVLLAGSLAKQAHLYIWDEPLNFIDLYSRIQIENLILAHNPTMLFVEHDRVFTQKTATRTIEL